MKTPNVPDALIDQLMEAVRPALEQAAQRLYADVYARGAADMQQRIMKLAMQEATIVDPPARQRIEPKTEEEAAHPNSAAARRFPYGAVANAFRDALRRTGPWGNDYKDLVGLASEILGEDVSDMQHRDTFKRLKKAGEMKVVNGRYHPGPNLIPRNENGALNGQAASAPDAGGAATPPIENQSTLGLNG